VENEAQRCDSFETGYSHGKDDLVENGPVPKINWKDKASVSRRVGPVSAYHVLSIVGLVLLFAFAMSRFAYDAGRLFYPVNDLTPIWVSAKAFVAGRNPYSDYGELERIWATTGAPSAEGCLDYNCILQKYPMGYPPTALPLIALFALVSLSAAVYDYLLGSVALFAITVLMLARRLPPPWSSLRRLYFIAFTLALAPLHAGIHHSNLSTFVVALLCLGVTFMEKRPYVSGTALAISLCLKPQVAFLFFAYPWLRRCWRTVAFELIAVLTISAGSLFWLGVHHVEVIHAYLASLAEFMPPGGHNSFYSPSPTRYSLINLQVLTYQFTRSPVMANLLSWTLFLALAVPSAFLVRSGVSAKNDGLGIAIVSVLTLLPVYQQIYTGAILLFVVYWAFQNWPRATAKAAIVLMLPLLFPLTAMTWQSASLAEFVERHHLSSYFLWNAFVMPHVVWIELFLVAILFTELYGSVAKPRTLFLER
jgi:hypothetical protein